MYNAWFSGLKFKCTKMFDSLFDKASYHKILGSVGAQDCIWNCTYPKNDSRPNNSAATKHVYFELLRMKLWFHRLHKGLRGQW